MLKAVMIDRSSQEEVDEFNEQMKGWINLYYPGNQKSKEEEVQGMAETFQMLFRGSDGKPKTINMEVGKNEPNAQINNYLQKIKKEEK